MKRQTDGTVIIAFIIGDTGLDISSWSLFLLLAILVRPGLNMNGYSSQEGIEQETLLGTSSERGEFEVVLLSFEDSLC